MLELPAELQHIDSADKMLQQIALVNLVAIVESCDDIMSPAEALSIVQDRLDSMDSSARIQSVQVPYFLCLRKMHQGQEPEEGSAGAGHRERLRPRRAREGPGDPPPSDRRPPPQGDH